MIDFIQLELSIKQNFNEWFCSMGSGFDEIQTKRDKYHVRRFKNLVVEVYPKSKIIKVEGSLHRHFNNGTHNYNDFDRIALFDTVVEVCQILKITPQNAHIHGIEFGVNILTPFKPSYLLERLLSLNTETAKKQNYFFDFYEFDFSKYRFKIYNKSEQHKLNIDLLRVEVHVKKMQWLSGKGSSIKTLEDLQQLHHLQKLGEILINCFDEVIIAEPLDSSTMTAKDALQYEQLTIRDNWSNLNPKQRFRQKEKFERIICKYATGETLKEIARVLVLQKWNDLLSVSGVEVLERLYQVGTPDIEPLKLQNWNDSTGWENTPPSSENGMIVPLDIKGTIIPIIETNTITNNDCRRFLASKKKCANCRKILSNDTLTYCGTRCKEKKDKRNNKSNPMHRTKRKVLKIVLNPQPPLFEQKEFIRIEPMHARWLEGFGVVV
jgi:hypothetical protein